MPVSGPAVRCADKLAAEITMPIITGGGVGAAAMMHKTAEANRPQPVSPLVGKSRSAPVRPDATGPAVLTSGWCRPRAASATVSAAEERHGQARS